MLKNAHTRFLSALALSLLLAIPPASALPKSPFLGIGDPPAPGRLLSQPNLLEPASRLPAFDLQISPSPQGLYSLNDVALEAPAGPVNFVIYGYLLLTAIPLTTAIVGHVTHHETLRDVSNIILYPNTLILPYLDALLILPSEKMMGKICAWLGVLATTSGLIMATIGEATDHHSLRNAGNWTYVGGAALTPIHIWFLFDD